jgi:dTDP-4-dehydrorhamnose reductase
VFGYYAGTLHYSDSGVASWYDFAIAIQEEALAAGLLPKAVPVIPITTEEWPAAAVRPHFSVLDKQLTWAQLGAAAAHWRVNLRTLLGELEHHG